jgi:GT2 family glycosyltransferase
MGVNLADFRRLGGFDQQFELYYEDVDICRRASALGSITFVTQVWGDHLGGASSRQLARDPYVAARVSRVRYLVKHHLGPHSSFPVIIGIALIEFIARSLSFQSEGMMVRWDGVRFACRELRGPGSVRVLKQGKGH